MADLLFDTLATEGRRADARRRQEELRAKYGDRLNLDPARANYSYGLAREQSAVTLLLALKAEDAPQMGAAALDAKKAEMFNALAEGYALQGRFGDAAAVALDPARRGAYAARAEAVSSLGHKLCACPDEVTVASATDAKGERRKTSRVVERVWDAEGGRALEIMLCDPCGTLSARVAEK